MRSVRAIIAGLGATGLLQAVACVLVLGGALMAFHGSPGRRGLGEGGAAVRVTHRGGRALRRLVVAVGPAARAPRRGGAGAGGGVRTGGVPGRRSRVGADGGGASPSRSGHGAGGGKAVSPPPHAPAAAIRVGLPRPVNVVRGGVTSATGHLGSVISRTGGSLSGAVGRVSPSTGETVAHTGGQVGSMVGGGGQTVGRLLPVR